MTLNHHHNDYHATTLSTYGLNYFNDTCSTSDCSDGYQSSISPVTSPPENYFSNEQQNYSNSLNYQTNQYYQQNQNDFYTPPSSYKLDVQIKPYQVVKTEPVASAPPKLPSNQPKVNRFAQQFNQQHQNLTKQFLEQSTASSSSSSLTSVASTEAPIVAPAPEILKRRRVAANARERRRMNNLNFAFDR